MRLRRTQTRETVVSSVRYEPAGKNLGQNCAIFAAVSGLLERKQSCLGRNRGMFLMEYRTFGPAAVGADSGPPRRSAVLGTQFSYFAKIGLDK